MAYLMASESLSRAFESEGKLDEAIRVLEEVSQEKAATYPNPGPSGYFWLRDQVRLAALYRKAGRQTEALKVESELLKLLALADPDHPILRQLRAAQLTASK